MLEVESRKMLQLLSSPASQRITYFDAALKYILCQHLSMNKLCDLFMFIYVEDIRMNWDFRKILSG